MKPLELFVVCFSVVSCCFSLAVIGTILFFRRMQIGKFMPIILFISVCDLGQNFASAFGFPDDNTDLCWFQGMVSGFFTVAGWFWTTILAYRIYCLVRYSKCLLSIRSMHLIAWGMSLILCVLPMSSVDYGAGPTQSQWCVFVKREGEPRWWVIFWDFFSFFGWLFILSGMMIAWQIIVFLKFRDSPMLDVIKRTYDKVYLYPIVMIACWSLNFIADIISFRENDSTFTAISMIFAVSNGILSALIFMYKSEEARSRWVRYFKPVITTKKSQFESNVEPEVQLDFELDDVDDITDYTSQAGMSIGNLSDISMVNFSDRTYSTNNPMCST